MLGASHSELALVGMLFLLVLVAPKIPRIGEWIGARFEPPGPAGPPSGRRSSPAPAPPDSAEKRGSQPPSR